MKILEKEFSPDGQIAILSINRIEKRNAINDELLLSIESSLDEMEDKVRCVIIQGKGDNFSAGLDLSEIKERDLIEGLMHSRMWHRVMDKIQFAKWPIISVLKGAVIGGGLEIASASHIRIAENSAFFALPEAQRGIFVGGGASLRLPKLIGTARMMDLMLTGRVYHVEEAERYGLIQYITPNEKGLEKALELAKRVLSNSETTNFALTNILPKIANSAHSEASMMESLIAAISSSSPEAKKRLDDFLQGRAKKVNG
ncbi:MAG: hypothetical protein RIR51_442 [Bacteroidota bacterium]|jgi:enoyl-CoA hydratase/carnithine racemase